MISQDIRWVQRLENFSKACKLLSEIYIYDLPETPMIIREGFIQRFEITFDLAWKTVNDFLRFLGHNIQPSPRPVIKEAFAAGIIADGQVFIDMLQARNVMSHMYDKAAFDEVFRQIADEFYPAFEKLNAYLEGHRE